MTPYRSEYTLTLAEELLAEALAGKYPKDGIDPVLLSCILEALQDPYNQGAADNY